MHENLIYNSAEKYDMKSFGTAEIAVKLALLTLLQPAAALTEE